MAQHTKDMLADELRKVGLTAMADKAATGFYHDFLSPLDLPELQLMNDLADVAARQPPNKADVLALRQRVMNGDFDASQEESEAWAASKEGQDTFRKLMPKR